MLSRLASTYVDVDHGATDMKRQQTIWLVVVSGEHGLHKRVWDWEGSKLAVFAQRKHAVAFVRDRREEYVLAHEEKLGWPRAKTLSRPFMQWSIVKAVVPLEAL